MEPEGARKRPTSVELRRLFQWLRAAELRLKDPRFPPKLLAQADTFIGFEPAIDAFVSALGDGHDGRPLRQEWAAAVLAYDRLRRSASVAGSIRLPPIKPIQMGRNAFHVAMAIGGVGLYRLTDSRPTMLALCGTVSFVYLILEVLRRRSPEFNERLFAGSFGALSRPSERHHIPGGAWFIWGALIGVIALPQTAIEIGFIVLGIGDPAAALIGRRVGRVPLWRERTASGTLAFLVSAFVGVWLYAQAFDVPLSLGALSACVLAGAMVELFSGPVDDNIAIPLTSGVVAMSLLA